MTTPGGGNDPRRVVLVTGLSGAGLSTTLKTLEDLGYEAVDNLPLVLLDPLVSQNLLGGRPVAAGIDSRTRGFTSEALIDRAAALNASGRCQVEIVFVEATDDVLQRRFTETRRRHPLASDRPALDGIALERALMGPAREAADHVIDTTDLSIHDLRRMLATRFGLGETPALTVYVMSFAYRGGVPREADLVFDVRFLKNPHWDADLRPMTGRDPAVGAYVASDPDFPGFFDNLKRLLLPLLPRYAQEGKSYLTIAFGCSGGKHRSVYLTEQTAAWLAAEGHRVGFGHRELDRI